jgi:hypothetical protein
LSIVLGDGTATQTLTDVCAIFESSVWCKSKFTVSSDERIKTNIQDINDDEALQKILLIQSKKYENIDKVERGSNFVFGFIAQQIKEVLPDAIAFYPGNNDLDVPTNPNTDIYWSSVLNVAGTIKPGISQIWLQNPYMVTDIVGTIVPNPNDDRLLIYNIDPDTLPQNTLSPVDGVINPQLTGPNAGLPGPVNGCRYLLTDYIGLEGSTTVAWGSLVANANDIIEYSTSDDAWFVSFDSTETTPTTLEYVTNLTTNVQYRFVDGTWMKSYEGWYGSGDFSIVI